MTGQITAAVGSRGCAMWDDGKKYKLPAASLDLGKEHARGGGVGGAGSRVDRVDVVTRVVGGGH